MSTVEDVLGRDPNSEPAPVHEKVIDVDPDGSVIAERSKIDIMKRNQERNSPEARQ